MEVLLTGTSVGNFTLETLLSMNSHVNSQAEWPTILQLVPEKATSGRATWNPRWQRPAFDGGVPRQCKNGLRTARAIAFQQNSFKI